MGKPFRIVGSERSGAHGTPAKRVTYREVPARSTRHRLLRAVLGTAAFGCLAASPGVYATTYPYTSYSVDCPAPTVRQGPDGVVRKDGKKPVDGTGFWSNVIGCSASGGDKLGVQVIGPYSTATGSGAVAIGFSTTAAQRATAVGMVASATGMGSTALGQWASATGTGSIAIGGSDASNTAAAGAQAPGTNAIAIGGESRAAGASAIALGRNAIATNAGDVALGAGARTAVAVGTSGTTLGGKAYTFAGATPSGTVSVGDTGKERTITNVAAGRVDGTSTDAINGSQLFATYQALLSASPAAGAVEYDKTPEGTINFSRVTMNPAGSPTTVTNVAPGKLSPSSTDVVNGAQLYETNQNLRNIAGDAGQAGTDANGVGIRYVRTNDTGLDRRDASARGQGSTAVGYNALAGAASALAVGREAQATGAQAISLGNGSVVSGAQAVSLGGSNIVSGDGAIAIGSRNVLVPANVLALGNGIAIRDANLAGAVVLGNGSTATAAVPIQGLVVDGMVHSFAGGHPAPGDVLSIGSVTAPRQIQNVAAGRLTQDSIDAVNGSQLYVTNQLVRALDEAVKNIGEGGNRAKYFNANGGVAPPLPDSLAAGPGSVAAGPMALAKGVDSTAVGNGAIAGEDGDVALGAGALAAQGRQRYVGDYSGAMNDTVGSVAVGAAGAERTISHTADGRFDTDAVNKRQLDGAVSRAVALAIGLTNQTLVKSSNSPVSPAPPLTRRDGSLNEIRHDIAHRMDGNGEMFKINPGKTIQPPTRASGENSMAVGTGAEASGENSAAVGNGAKASGNHSTALGNGSRASATQSVALGAGSVATRDNTVSIGIAGGERQIANVRPGTAGTDAVNVNQLRAIHRDFSQQLAGVRGDMQHLEGELSAGIAAAMAMAGLPQATEPGKHMFSFSGATWRGEGGLAMALSSVSADGRWVLKGVANTSSRGDVGASVGVGFLW